MSRAAVRSSGVVVPHSVKWQGRVAAGLIYLASRSVAATQRYRVQDERKRLSGGIESNAIFCIWHNRLALSLPVYNEFLRARPPGFRLAAMVSASKDGALLARILEHFGVQPVRGSSSRRGPQALLELTTWAERGFDIAITPDGPRGPRYIVQDGVMALAQITGLAIVPTVFNLQPKICAKSWDRFQVPIPFGSCEIIFDKPLRVPREISGAERETIRMGLEKRMRDLTRD